MQILFTYLGTLVSLLLLDGIWLGLVAKNFYAQAFGNLMRTNPIWWAAGLFYIFYAAGILILIIMPHAHESWWHIVLYAALLGFVAYMTYDLTSLAITTGFPAQIVVADIAWGTIATAVAGAVGYFIFSAFR